VPDSESEALGMARGQRRDWTLSSGDRQLDSGNRNELLNISGNGTYALFLRGCGQEEWAITFQPATKVRLGSGCTTGVGAWCGWAAVNRPRRLANLTVG